ncbi:MAG: VTC domain-containing protein, partial [Chloroflexota bacterium]
MTEAQTRSYRYERKFLVEELDAGQARLMVKRHPSMFYEAYPPRVVNNLYLDTEDMDNYFANLAGADERCKVRVRWYGELFGEIASPVLEFKIKSGLVGRKQSYPFPVFRLDEDFSQRVFQDLARGADLPDSVRHHLRTLNVVLCNNYRRWYYATRDGRYRLTVDAEMAYYRVKKFGNRFLGRVRDDGRVIVEMKYEKPFEAQSDRVAGFFPFRITRNSKYVTG